MIRVGSDNFARVGGTMIGGGTLIGLANLLTGINDFSTIIEMAKSGSNANVDMVVDDIYGDNSPFKELRGDLLASSFAKVATDLDNDRTEGATELQSKYMQEDVLASLVTMISINIGQLAFLTAKMNNIKKIYFAGNYVQNNELGQEQIKFAVNVNQGIGLMKPPADGSAVESPAPEVTSHFVSYDGYLGAIGALMNDFNDGHGAE